MGRRNDQQVQRVGRCVLVLPPEAWVMSTATRTGGRGRSSGTAHRSVAGSIPLFRVNVRTCVPEAISAESMLMEPSTRDGQRITSGEDAKAGKGLVGLRRVRLRVHHAVSIGIKASRGPSRGASHGLKKRHPKGNSRHKLRTPTFVCVGSGRRDRWG